jgi:hypothetical protein
MSGTVQQWLTLRQVFVLQTGAVFQTMGKSSPGITFERKVSGEVDIGRHALWES